MSWSEREPAKLGIPAMWPRGGTPLSTTEMMSVGLLAITTGLPANGGTTLAIPSPLGLWHLAQLSE
jgi:hypothetical protein